MQVELIHVVQNVVAVRRNQVMIMVNFLLLPNKKKITISINTETKGYEELYLVVSRETC